VALPVWGEGCFDDILLMVAAFHFSGWPVNDLII